MRKISKGKNMQAQRKANKISEHFAKKDFICRCGDCDNSIRISLGLIGGLELLRSKVNSRIDIVKGYICPESAEKDGRLKKNYHTLGLAADIKCSGVSFKEFFLQAEETPEFIGIGINIDKKYLHVDTRKDKERKIWVFEGDEEVPITSSNREDYLEKLK
ncbi:D-Ala-D-Ala carboxypeptidase family metallohydrolase [Candidatus Margulisiibacteriota bacterium]